MQSEQCQDKRYADPVVPREPAWRRSLIAFRHMLNIGNITLLQDLIWIHSCETLLLDRVYWVRNTLECSGIPEKKVRQVLRVLREKCCRATGRRWHRKKEERVSFIAEELSAIHPVLSSRT